MKKHQIIIVDKGTFTQGQKLTLTALEFKTDDSTPTRWIYRAMDIQDLVSVAEDLALIKCLDGIPYKIGWGELASEKIIRRNKP